MSLRETSDSDRHSAAQKKPWLAPKAQVQPVRAITAGTTAGTADGTGGCHS